MDTIDKAGSQVFLSYFQSQDIVVVAPLNWGLGHACRCIPLISLLRQHCAKVIIATDGAAMDLLKDEFDDIDKYSLPGYGIRYKYESIFLNILIALPKIIRAVFIEKSRAEDIIKATGATVILSDNRLGFRAKGAKNFYLTHQINILHKYKIISIAGTYLHQWFIKKFQLCFVPDYKGKNALCPALSQSKRIDARYIGPLTRIKKTILPKIYDICIVLSGPEPQRSVLEGLLLKEINILIQFKILIIRGVANIGNLKSIGDHITIKNLINSSEMEVALNSSKLMICRSGYSTIMDINTLDKSAIFIPTPGQTEQEYLAQKCEESGRYTILKQNEINKLNETIKYLI